MILWITSGILFAYTNFNRPFTGGALFTFGRNCVFYDRTNFTGGELRLIAPLCSQQWRFFFFYYFVYSYFPKSYDRLLLTQLD